MQRRQTRADLKNMQEEFPVGAGFLGLKAEHGHTWTDILNYILQDYIHWRRNYFPEDEQILDRATRRAYESWFDVLSNELDKVLNQLKADYPFYSPRYQGHMVSETLVSGVVGYFAGMLYNPNNVSSESAPITLNLELEAGRMIAKMLGYDPLRSWSHITSGGTIANMEALWAARQNQLNGVAVQEVCRRYKIPLVISQPNGEKEDIRNLEQRTLIKLTPGLQVKLPFYFEKAVAGLSGLPPLSTLLEEVNHGKYSISRNGVYAVYESLDFEPVILASQAGHYSIRKIANLLGLGERNVISLPVDRNFRVDMDALRSIVDKMPRHQVVLALIGTLGTTEEGAIDPLSDMVAFRKEQEAIHNRSFWFHVDAAWGGYLRTLDPADNCFSPFVREALNSLPEADSITVDPHKMGYIPYSAGVINFREKYAVLHSHQVAPYISLRHKALDPLDSTDLDHAVGPYIIEGSKPGAAAVATWLTHKTIPLTPAGHGKLIKASLENAKCFYDYLVEGDAKQLDDDFPVQLVPIGPPDCNVLCYYFRIEERATLALQNELNQRVYRAFTLNIEDGVREMPYRQEYFISHTHFFSIRYPYQSISHLLANIDSPLKEYETHGLFLLRSVIINPWLSPAREKGTDHLRNLAGSLYTVARREYRLLINREQT